MKAEEYFAGYIPLKRQAAHLRRRIVELTELKRQEYSTIAGKSLGMPRGTDISDPVYRACERMELLYDEKIGILGQKLSQICGDMFEIEIALELGDFSADEREYLRLRFFEGFSAAEIARKMNFSPRQITRIRASALSKAEKKTAAQNGGSTARRGAG